MEPILSAPCTPAQRQRDVLLGALVGLARSTVNEPKTEDTDHVLAAGLRQGGRIFLCGLAAAGIWSLVLLIRRGIARQRLTYLVFYLYRSALGGSVEPYYLEARDGKEASFCLAPCLFLGVIGAELIRYL